MVAEEHENQKHSVATKSFINSVLRTLTVTGGPKGSGSFEAKYHWRENHQRTRGESVRKGTGRTS